MQFKNIPGRQHANARANLERAFWELDWYERRIGAKMRNVGLFKRVEGLLSEIENANPENAGQLFKQARQMCIDMEKTLCSK